MIGRNRQFITRSWLFVPLLALSMACAGNPLSIQPIPVTADPSAQVDAFSGELEAARQDKLAVLSPGWFEKAKQSYETAKKTRDGGGAVQEILTAVATGRAQLVEARKFASISQTTFPTVIQARDDARTAGAISLGEKYSTVEDQFLQLTAAIEQDSLGWAQRKAPSVEKAFRAVELKAIQETTSKQIRALIDDARSEDAEKLTPKLLAETESQYRSLQQFITDNRYAGEEIGRRAKETLFQANRLLAFTREARAIDRESAEAQLLRQEAQIAAVVTGIGAPDSRDQSFQGRYDQLAASAREVRRDRDSLVQRTESLRGDIANLNQKIVKLEGRSSEERAQLAELESRRRFDELYNEVSAYFDPQEAEVYKQGSKLVVRLRSIQFPVGDYVLQPDNYALLSKVQRAIRAFGDPSVVIEGHTDTTGSKELNDHLSEKRAEAVAKYLVANNTLPPEDIHAVGMGFSVPLASNNTAAGRALNRRIDVILDARQQSATPAVSSGPKAGTPAAKSGQ